MSIENTCAFTGHRPKSFSFGYDEAHPDCVEIKRRLAEEIEAMFRGGVDTFVSGAAEGVDMWAMEAVLELKKREPSVRLTAAIPYRGQPSSWSEPQQERYRQLLARCDEVELMSERYRRGCYHARDRRMIDGAAHVIAVYNGSGEGGTAYTVAYAKKKGRNIVVIEPNETIV